MENIIQSSRFALSTLISRMLTFMPRFAPTIKVLLMNKEKLLELAKNTLNENWPRNAPQKLPEKLEIPANFLSLFHFPTDFVVVDFEADPRVPLILGRSFLRTSRALIDVYERELILKDGDERLIFHVNKHPQKHANEPVKMINFIDVSCEDSFGEVLRNEDVDFEAELREIELLLNRNPSTNFSPTFTIDPNPKKFTDKPAPACLPPPGDDNDDESFLKEDVQEENF
ncbi:reverse transcriptase domain-containing protein [Tanacetum coccineum]